MRWACSTSRFLVWAAVLAIAVPLAFAGKPRPRAPKAPKLSAAAQSLQDYLRRVREVTGNNPPPLGSLWTNQGGLTDLSSDYKARNINDLVVIRVVESTSAAGTGAVKSQRDFSASSGISGLFGTVGPTSGLQSLFTPTSARALTGTAQTSSSSQLSTSLTGRVVDVLPNGVMVVEAARNILMNNEQQTVIVRGLVRPGDVAPDNSVLSTQVGSLEVQLLGKGVITDGTQPPMQVTRWVLRLLGF